jgi:hypothetical protein
MITHSRSVSLTSGGNLVGAASDSQTGDAEVGFSDTIAISTNKEVDLAFAYAKVKSFAFYSPDGAVTLFTNANDGGGGNTLAIPAGLTVWNANDAGACPFSHDVTKLFVDNASATKAVKVTLKVLLDLS